MPEIVVNGRFLSRQVTGVERSGREILSVIGGRCRVEKTRAQGFAGHLWEQTFLQAKLSSKSILWSPANSGPLMAANQALTIHDLSPLEHPHWFKNSFAWWYRLFLPLLAKRVRVIFTPSDYVKRKIMKRFEVENVRVVRNGVNTTFFHPDATQRAYQLPESFILFVGSIQPRKNLQTLLKTWEDIQDDFSGLWLVIAGDTGRIYNKVQMRKRERVQFLGYVTEAELPGLYAKATLFVLPSLDEGFGLPALEAMACGTPVIVSDGGALPEVVGNAALRFRLADPCSLANTIRACLESRELCSSLIARGLEHVQDYSWRHSAEVIWNTLNEIEV